MRRVTLACVVALGLVLGGGGAAMAGEVNGNGTDIPGAANSASECAFSGQDTPDAIENPLGLPGPENNDDAFAVRGSQKHGYHGVQSYGSVVKAGLKPFAPSPGDACRGNLGKK